MEFINIRSTTEVVYDEILQDLVHCKNCIEFLRSLANHNKTRKKYLNINFLPHCKAPSFQYTKKKILFILCGKIISTLSENKKKIIFSVREFKTPDIQENNVSNKHSDLSERKQHAHL